MGRSHHAGRFRLKREHPHLSARRGTREGDPVYWARIWTLFGVVLGLVALFTKGVATDAEELLPALSEASPDSPDGVPTIWGAWIPGFRWLS
jgi:hypothetical protein